MSDEKTPEQLLQEAKSAKAKADSLVARAEAELSMLKEQYEQAESRLSELGFSDIDSARLAISQRRREAHDVLQEAVDALSKATQ